MQTFLHKLFRLLFVSFIFLIYLHASVTSPISIDMNSTVNGNWVEDSDISPRSNHYAEYYSFSLTEDNEIIINLESDYSTIVYLLDSNGTIIDYSYGNHIIGAEIVSALKAGIYKLEVTTNYYNEIGTFSLSLHKNFVDTLNIDIGTSLSGEWNNSSGLSSNSGNFANYYIFTLTEKKDVYISLKGYSKKVYLLDSNNTIIDSSFKDGNNNDAVIVQTLDIGTYKIDATIGYRNQVGSYVLSLKENRIENNQLILNSTTNDDWIATSGYSSITKRHTHYYTFTLLESKEIVISSVSNNNMKLYLLDSNSNILANYSFSRNSRIVKTLEAGTYTIDISIADNSISTGSFTLYFRENILESTNIDINSSIYGEWSNTSSVSPQSNHYSQYYTFTLLEKKNIIIDLDCYIYEGSYHNAILYLLDNNGSIIDKVMGGSRSDTRIERILEPGTYTIDVSTFADIITGSFTLNFNENVIKTTNILLNSSIDGEWTNNSGVSSRSKRYTCYYTFSLDETKDVIIDLKSSLFYNKIYLIDSSNNVIERNNRLVKKLEAGTYIIDATTDYSTEVGRFVLNVRENIILTKDIIFNKPTDGEWLDTSGVYYRSGGLANAYTFTLAEKKEVTIKLKSNSMGLLYILDENDTIIANSGYYNTNSNVELTKVLDVGKYKIIVTNYQLSNELGTYMLKVTANVTIPNKVSEVITLYSNVYSTILKWSKSDKGTVGYKIYLNNKLVADVNASESSYTLNGLVPNSEYTYSVIAYNSAGESKAVSATFKTKEDDYAWLIPIQQNILN